MVHAGAQSMILCIILLKRRYIYLLLLKVFWSYIHVEYRNFHNNLYHANTSCLKNKLSLGGKEKEEEQYLSLDIDSESDSEVDIDNIKYANRNETETPKKCFCILKYFAIHDAAKKRYPDLYTYTIQICCIPSVYGN